ncbi:GNAT family N-acetyltransferase [Mycoplasma todarodis]|uniref:GNAT family N-acetyltransferase n=1 Tax=Mycoplasma todarodis TaxID=1937191 RepID=UPI003B2FFE59
MAQHFKMRRLKRKDWRDMFEYGSDAETTQFLRWGPYKTEEEAKESNKMLRKGSDQVFAIVSYGKMIGTITFMNITDTTVEVGFVLNKEYWGMGIGTMALTRAMNFAYRWHKKKSIVAIANKNNEASQGLLKKCGFEIDKQVKDDIYFIFKI